MLTVVADADHEEHDDLVEWLGDDFDPEAFDIDEVNDMLAEWREG
ncbi:Plasmid pRiA4b ORF-3-like protein [Mucisphaera calidilacus]|uniref:Plasmid pRiA4b ORF-3-like protein n=2 Tax=Mucisphaera calidilacus TaxID=2527982 RepID=A0A518BU70_9BACT|nr:Plasmid pRiA4b ORF-3-like protein [Mucisphaera calidilacus]